MIKEIMMDSVTKEIKKQFKNASNVIFRLDSEGQSMVEVRKEIEIDGYKTELIERFNTGTKKKCYEDYTSGTSYQYKFIKGFYSMSIYDFSNLQWLTIVNNLKIGDQIKLEWVAGNSNKTMEKNNLTCDDLFLIIIRDEKEKFKFKIDHVITEKNSLARMITLEKNI